ncbi:MAG TPA: pectinesterase family protein, partial [Flavobacterium sp.]
MKRKLRLLILMMLFSVSFIQAQIKTDVWDFGGAILDPTLYNNNLTEANINAWYSVAGGTNNTPMPLSTVLTLPSLSPQPTVLTFKTGSSADRLYTSNTALTRQATGNLGTTDANYTARYYCNGAASSTNRFFTFKLNADDEVTIVASIEPSPSSNLLTVVNTTTNTQTETIPLVVSGTTVTLAKFVAKEAGDFKISCLGGKGNYYRILRKPASYTTINGSVNAPATLGGAAYSVVFTNSAGKQWSAPVTSIASGTTGTYSVMLPAGTVANPYTYQMSLSTNANGYIISNGNSLAVTDATPTTTYTTAIQKVDLFTVTGSITGLNTDISKLTSLTYTPDPTANKVFIPKPVITGSTYTVELEAGTKYTVSGQGVNDYQITSTNPIVEITGNTSVDVTFAAKTKYLVDIATTGLNASQIANLTLTFTNLNESGYVYTFGPGLAINSGAGTFINLRTGTYAVTSGGLDSSVVMTLTSNLKVTNVDTSKPLVFVAPADTSALPYEATLYVGTDKTYKTINAALAAITRMTLRGIQRVTIMIDPGNYEEMLVVNQVNVSLKNAATTPNINLFNKGVDIDLNAAVRITSYYGHGYDYYSMNNQKWDADVLRVNKANGYLTSTNAGGVSVSGSKESYWNATVVIKANGFEANDIIFENSYNQYISKKESEDILVLASGNKGIRWNDLPTNTTGFDEGSTKVQDKTFVERAAAIAIVPNIDKVVLNKCRVIGRQDSFYGGAGAKVVVYKGVMMGSTDYIFGGMDAVFYQSDLAMNTSDASGDYCLITAPQQSTGRGFLMYECKVTSAIPGTETASVYRSKPGYYGRPWQPGTSEAVFFKTTIETSNYPGSIGKSLILPLGWLNTLNGAESPNMLEYGTIEQEVDINGNSIDNSAFRAPNWGGAHVLISDYLKDGITRITYDNFIPGNTIDALKAADPLGTKKYEATSSVIVYGNKNNVVVSNVKSNTTVMVYSLNGALVKSFD